MSTIVTAVSHILRPNAERPTVLLLLATTDAKESCARIARATAGAAISAFRKPSYKVDQVIISCSDYSCDDDFWKFFKVLHGHMSSFKVVVLTNFERINPHVATVLCHLAGGTYPPIPQDKHFTAMVTMKK